MESYIIIRNKDNANNRTLACKPCNSSRGHDMSDLFKKGNA